MLQSVADRFARGTVLTSESSAEALRIAASKHAAEGLICIAGSLYLVGELRPLILNCVGKQYEHATPRVAKNTETVKKSSKVVSSTSLSIP